MEGHSIYLNVALLSNAGNSSLVCIKDMFWALDCTQLIDIQLS